MKMHMVAAINNALDLAMKEDKNIIILGEDVGVDGGVFRVTDGLIDKHGEDRVVDTPIAEAGIIGAATGLALNGMKPIAELQFSGFIYQAFHHIKQHVARYMQRTNGTRAVPMVIRAPCSGGIKPLEHHSESPEAFVAHCQGVKVVMPSGPYEAKGLLTAAIKDPDPVVFLEPKKIYRSFKEDVPEESYEIPLDKANVVQEGTDLTIITWGAMLKVCQAADEELKKQGTSAEIIDIRTIWPLDMETILASAKKTGRVVIVHEAAGAGGWGGEIATRIQEKAILSLKAPIMRVTGMNVPFPQCAYEHFFLPTPKRVLNQIKKLMEF